MTQNSQEHPKAALPSEIMSDDDATIIEPVRKNSLCASPASNAQCFACLAVPRHAQTAPPADAGDTQRDDKAKDPISEAGWLAAADALLMGGLLNDW